jgi:HTH-type transcriptional regulator/antitoxin HipB
MTVPFKNLRAKWMADPGFRKAYDRVSPAMEIAFAIAEARHRAMLSQAQLAEKISTSQSMVARWETGTVLPSTKTLMRIAEATSTRLQVELVPSQLATGKKATKSAPRMPVAVATKKATKKEATTSETADVLDLRVRARHLRERKRA